TDATASRVEQSDLIDAVAKTLSELFQALSVTLWIVDEPNETISFAASTSVTNQQGPTREESAAIIAALRANPDPHDIETIDDRWASTLRRCHPDQFKE